MRLRLEVLSFFILLFSCSQNENTIDTNTDFIEVKPNESGIDFINELTFTPELNIIEYLYFNNGGGVAIGDINNDGLEDLFFTANQKSDQLYLNKGSLNFEKITLAAGINEIPTWSTGVTMDDVNGDGWKDIYVCKVGPLAHDDVHNELYINQGDGTFIEKAKEYGIDFHGYSTQVSFFDYDRDGDLDMYLLNHSVHSTQSYGPISKRKIGDDLSGDRLFQNRLSEEGRYVDVTEEAGIYSSALGYGLGLITSDLNNDGWVDIYVGNDFHENDYFYLNNGDGTFSESIEKYFNHTSQFTMGVDAADINGDGKMDLFTTDMMPYHADIYMRSGGNDTEQIVDIKKDFGYLTQYSRNMLQISEGKRGYSEQALITKTFATDWSWSVLLQDFDNSGSTDIFISNGIINRPNDLDYIQYINTPENRQREDESIEDFNKRLIAEMPTLKLPNVLFLQNESLDFTSIHKSEIGTPNYSNGSAFADLDKDGTLEIISNNINGSASILKKSSSNFHFVSFDLGSEKNSKVEIFYNGQSQKKEFTTTRGYQSSSTHYIHFGLGQVERVDSCRILWPDGTVQVEKNISVDNYHKIEKNGSIVNMNPEQNVSTAGISVLPIEHVENAYDDIDAEPLLPYRISQEGPAALYEDFDNDGYKDLFIGGAKGQKISYLKGGKANSFSRIEVLDFNKDAKYEDVDAAVIDFNNDGFEDIYVVSGGNEYNELDKGLEDRLYINDQRGGFFRLNISLPHMNGSVVAVADYDGDGYEDFFVGSSNVPGAFGVSPVSFIIKNVQGQRLEIVHRDRIGMVSDALWADLNDDGSEEIIIVGKWMPLTILTYDGDSTFTDFEMTNRIPNVSGLFECIEVADINGDSTLDFILGNLGLNTALSIDNQESIDLYLSDFDKNTFLDPIIFHDYFGQKIPFVDKVTLQSQMPSLKKSFPSFKKYSEFTDISMIQNKEVIMDRMFINTLSSLLLVSDGNDYVMKELPRECQLSSIEDVEWIVDEEGIGQLLYVGNSRGHSHALGQSLSSGGGVLSDFDRDSLQFLKHTSLNLPLGTVSKEIVPITSQKHIIINNDNVQYQIEFEKN